MIAGIANGRASFVFARVVAAIPVAVIKGVAVLLAPFNTLLPTCLQLGNLPPLIALSRWTEACFWKSIGLFFMYWSRSIVLLSYRCHFHKFSLVIQGVYSVRLEKSNLLTTRSRFIRI